MRRTLAVLALLTLLMLGLVGCGDDGDSDVGADGAPTTTATDTSDASDTSEPAVEPFELAVTSVDFGYELATDEVPAGPVTVVQTNDGDQEHQVTLLRLDDGQTPEQLVQLITDEGDDALDPSAFAGGANSVPSGETNSATVDLAPGDYVTYCFLPQHAQQGMVAPFTVTGEAAAQATVGADTTVGLADFEFDVPGDFTGQGTVEVVNNGDQAHELTILHADDQTGAGGLATIGPGQTGYVPIDLAPGDYTFVCFVTDPESGQIHLQLGMEANVTVT